MFQSKISKLLVSKCFEHQYGIRLLQNSTTTVLLSSDAEEDEETNQERKIHPDDVKMMTQMIHLVWKLPLQWSDNDKGAIQVFLSKFDS